MANGFNDIYEELWYEAFKLTGNPYIMQEIVCERNARREKDAAHIQSEKRER